MAGVLIPLKTNQLSNGLETVLLSFEDTKAYHTFFIVRNETYNYIGMTIDIFLLKSGELYQRQDQEAFGNKDS